jgi:hypothetical protein
MLKCKRTNIWRDEILERRIRHIGAEIGIRRVRL